MTETTTDRLELARLRAHAFAVEQGSAAAAAEEFAGEYVAVLEDRLHEPRYPDLPPPTPEEVWFA